MHASIGMRPPSHLLHPTHGNDDTSLRLGTGHIGIGTYIASTSVYSWFFNNTRSSNNLGDYVVNVGTKAVVDNSCMQSREVWTGTTYALAAAMIHESYYSGHDDDNNDKNNNNDDNDYDGIDSRGHHCINERLTEEERIRLRSMAFNTARGA